MKNKFDSIHKERIREKLKFPVPKQKILNKRDMHDKYRNIVKSYHLEDLKDRFEGKYTLNFSPRRGLI